MSRTITIAGGGLAGLPLGIGLRRRGVPVTLLEAGTYPRHRVCGEFICGVADDLPPEAAVWSSGRRRFSAGEWLGLKCHLRGFEMDTDLQMHFGRNCYVGLSRVEGDTVNLCGLFKQRRELKAGARADLLLAYLRGNDLEHLADQVESGDIDPESLLGVSAFRLGRQARRAEATDHRLHLGDSHAMIPPFTGNGMTMAFQSAEIAVRPLYEFSRGKIAWRQAVSQIRHAHQQRFASRLRWAMRLHPFLLRPSGQKMLVAMAKLRVVPFGLFFRQTR